MNTTEWLVRADSTLNRHNEGNWDDPFDMSRVGFSSFNDAGVECEVGEYLYSLTRLLKPSNVLETGTHWGISTCYIAKALQDNNLGVVYTFEFDPRNYNEAVGRFNRTGLHERISAHLADAANFKPMAKFQLMFLDTEPQTRFSELLKFYPYLEEGGFVFIHDLHHHMHQIPNEEHGFAWPYGLVPEELKALVREGKLRPFHFKTPRGLTGFYKVRAEDYAF